MMTDDTMTTADALQVLACCGRAYLELNEDPSEATTAEVDEAMAHVFSLGILAGIRIIVTCNDWWDQYEMLNIKAQVGSTTT